MTRPLLVLLTLAARPLAAQTPLSEVPGAGLRALARLDELALRRSPVQVGAVTSYDPSGKNDDGFSGAHSFLRKEGDGLVIADLVGPGVVTRIWTPTPTDDPVEFYFDGEPSPRLRLPMRQLFLGGPAPFRPPLVGYGAGGYYSYVPLAYARSLKVVVRGPRVQFYQLNFARYDDSVRVESFAPSESFDPSGAVALLGATGRNLSRLAAPPGATVTRHAVTRQLGPGRSTVLFETDRGGRIVGLKLGPAAALMSADRATTLRISFDGADRPAVEAPVLDLFGGAWGRPAMAGLLAGTIRDSSYLWLPMPFDRSARVELVQAPDGPSREVWAEIFTSPVPRRRAEGRLHAIWRRENPTTAGRPFTFLRSEGSGHVVGVVLQAQGIGGDGTRFFEGDDRVVIDGDTVVAGTGSEDAFNGGWYDVPGRWDGRRSLPLSGSLGYSNPLGRTGGYRFLLADAYPWRRSIDFTIEHGEDTDNTIVTDHAAVTFLYSEDGPTWRSTELTADSRRPVAPERIVLNVGWSSPIVFFSTRFATLSKGPEPGIGRFLSFVGDSTPELGRHVLSLAAPVPVAGRYRVSVLPVLGPERGTVQLLLDDQPIGRPLDTRAEQRAVGDLTPLAELELDEGEAAIHLRITPSRADSRRAALDLVRVVLERLDSRQARP
ncbi:MAG: glycoside hydrolase family 172 protein [Gemmatimonadales bacterium]